MNPTAIIPINHPLTDFIAWNMSAQSLKAADCGPAAPLCYKCERHRGWGSYTCINGAHSTCLHGENQVVHLRNYLSAGASQQITVSIYFSEFQQEFRSTSSGRTVLIWVQWWDVKDRRRATAKVLEAALFSKIVKTRRKQERPVMKRVQMKNSSVVFFYSSSLFLFLDFFCEQTNKQPPYMLIMVSTLAMLTLLKSFNHLKIMRCSMYNKTSLP